MGVAELKAEIEEVAARYKAGAYLADIANDYGVARESVTNHLRRAGVPIRARGTTVTGASANRKLTREQEADVVRLYVAGATAKEAGAKHGVTKGTALRILTAAGAPKRPAGKAPVNRRINSQGYVLVPMFDDSDPMASMRTQTKRVLEHRLVMARALGRPLERDESVHHINGDRSDNRLVNLQLRKGQHGHGQCFRCADCGSPNVQAVTI